MTKTKVLCLLLVFLMVPAVWPGVITPYLQDKLQGMTASEQVDVIVMMQEQADINALNFELKTMKVTLAERNRAVI